MRKTILFRAMTYVVAILLLSVAQSCINKKYTLTDIDKNIYVFQEGICLPIGSTDTMSLIKLMSKFDLSEDVEEFFKYEDGEALTLSYGPETMDMSESLSSLSFSVDIDKVEFNHSVGLNLDNLASGVISHEEQVSGLGKAVAANVFKSYETPIETSFEFAPFEGVELPEMLESVNDIIFEEVYLSLRMQTSEGFPNIGEDGVLALELDMIMPDFVIVEDDRYRDGKLEISDKFVRNADKMEFVMNPVKLSGMDLNMSREQLATLAGSIVMRGNVTLSGSELDVDGWSGKNLGIDIIADIKTIEAGAETSREEKLHVKEVTGVVDYQMDPVEVSIDLSDLAWILEGSDNMSLSLGLKTFYVKLAVKTNLGVPLNADLQFTPYFGGEGRPMPSEPLTLDPAESSSELKDTRFWISDTAPAAGSGYEYIELDLLDALFDDASRTVMADSLKVTVIATTDTERECRFEPSADYEFVVEYEAGAPLEFGDNFRMEYRDTLDSLSPELLQIFNYGNIGLGGSIENTFPLNINFSLNMLDAAGDVVDMGEGFGSLVINACDASGEAVKTPLNLMFGRTPSEDMPEISAIEVVFSADSKGASGIQLSGNAYIRCELNARIPEGISLDLEKMGEADSE